MRKRRVIIVITLVAAQLVLSATQAFATFPWPIIGGGG
jgi:hypothetical protein